MELFKAIRELRQELDRVNMVIESLEQLLRTGTVTLGSHRGRKSMADEERRIVSERMKRYWANRRKPRS